MEDSKKAEYLKKYNEYKSEFNKLVTDEGNKAYFGDNGDLKDLKEELEKKLKALEAAIDNTYDEEKIDELMETLGELIAGSSTVMGLADRIEAYSSIVTAKEAGNITDDDYKSFLQKLNSMDTIITDDFNEDLDIAKASFGLREAEITSKTNQSLRLTKLSYLNMKVAQSSNMYKELEIDLKADEKLEDKSRSNENLKRLKNEGAWNDSMDRRKQILQEKSQEEAAQKARKEDK